MSGSNIVEGGCVQPGFPPVKLPPALERTRGSKSVKGFLRLVMIEHSVFALPFVGISALTAMLSLGAAVRWADLLLIVVAMVGARTFAMATNRVIDRELDSRNPRTANRELVTGALAVRTAVVGAVVALVVFFAAAALLSPLCLALAPIAVVPLVVYPYGKRFTWGCHFILGLAQMVGPIGAWIAVTGKWSWTALVLGAAVGIWIAGFDLIYACQDIASDREQGVYSLPARFGAATALRVAQVMHAATVALLLWFGVRAGMSSIWYVGVGVVAAALIYEHTLVKPHDFSRVNRAFFTVNGFVGLALLAFAIADLASQGLRP